MHSITLIGCEAEFHIEVDLPSTSVKFCFTNHHHETHKILTSVSVAQLRAALDAVSPPTVEPDCTEQERENYDAA